MAHINKRNKIILGAAGLLVFLAIAVGVVFALPGVGSLFGASIIDVNPKNPSIVIGQSVGVTASTIMSNCSWSSSNTTIAKITSSTTNTAQVLGMATGKATITISCALGLTKGNLGITVSPALGTPTNLHWVVWYAGIPATSQPKLIWDAVAGASGYEVWMSKVTDKYTIGSFSEDGVFSSNSGFYWNLCPDYYMWTKVRAYKYDGTTKYYGEFSSVMGPFCGWPRP